MSSAQMLQISILTGPVGVSDFNQNQIYASLRELTQIGYLCRWLAIKDWTRK